MLFTPAALRDTCKYDESGIGHFWRHVEAGEDHGGKMHDLLKENCTTLDLKEPVVRWARESARIRRFYFGGTFRYYEMNYKLAN